eukprot:Opistho-2@25353
MVKQEDLATLSSMEHSLVSPTEKDSLCAGDSQDTEMHCAAPLSPAASGSAASPTAEVDAETDMVDGQLRTKRRLDSTCFESMPSPPESRGDVDEESDGHADKRRRVSSESSSTSEQLSSGNEGSSPLAKDAKEWHSEDGEKTTRRGRTRFTDTQLEALESSFGKNDHPNFTQLAQIAACVGVSERSAKVWFQNRRAKERKSARPAVASSYRSMTPSNLSHAVQRHVAAKPRIEPAPAVPHSQPQTHAQLVTHSPFAPPRAAFQPMPPGGMGRMMPLPVPYASGKAVGAQIGGSHPVATVPRQLMSAQQCVQPSAPAQQGPSSLKASNNNSTAIHSSSNNTAMPVLIASAAHSLPSSRSPSQMQSHAQSGELCGLNLLGMAALMVAGQTV